MNKIDFIESERLSLEPISLKFLTKNYLEWLNDQEVYISTLNLEETTH